MNELARESRDGARALRWFPMGRAVAGEAERVSELASESCYSARAKRRPSAGDAEQVSELASESRDSARAKRRPSAGEAER